MTRMGRPRTKHRDMPVGCRQIAGRWYVEATNVHLAKVIEQMTGGRKSMPLAPPGKPAPTDKRSAREYYVRVFVRPLDTLVAADTGTVAELVALARIDLLPKYRSAKGRAEAERYLDAIDREFGSRRYARHAVEATTGQFLRRHEVQRYVFRRAEEDAPVAGNRLLNVLHRVFALASSLWGKTEYDPTEGVERNPEHPREQLPPAAQFDALYAQAPEWMQCAMLLARDFARRRGEILGLSDPDVTTAGLEFRRGKAREGRKPKTIIIEWTPELRAIADRLLAHKARIEARTGVRCMRLLVNEDGGPVTETGWNSAWARMIERTNRAWEKDGRADRIERAEFHFHDLRAVRPSMMARAEAQHLLAHDDAASTDVYRRGPHVISLKKAG